MKAKMQTLVLAVAAIAIILSGISLYYSLQQQHFRADTLYALGDLYMLENRPLAAAAAYEQAISAEKRPFALNALGNAYLRAGNFTNAERVLRQALDENATDWDALFILASAHLADGKYTQAEQELKIVIANVPTADNAYDALGTLYLDQNNTARAEETFKQGLEIANPNNANLHNGLGVTYMQTGRRDLAIEQFRIALNINPNHANARRNLEIVMPA